MPNVTTTEAAQAALVAELSKAIATSIRLLLETKHLYQSVSVDVRQIVEKHMTTAGAAASGIGVVAVQIEGWLWRATGHSAEAAIKYFEDRLLQNSGRKVVEWVAPDIKVYCHTCKRTEPFNPSASQNLGDVFALSYICQSCKGPPHVFLVRKSKSKLTVAGRTPMERVDVPKTIPKSVADFFSGAEIAHQSGQTLAGLFLLRTFCEQWARMHAPEGAYADEAITAYMGTLPDAVKSNFPSIAKLYSDLSAAIHKAQADVVLYDRAVADIRKHFDARAVFDLPADAPKVPK